MKIIKTSNDYYREKELKAIVLKECYVCPCCGETKTLIQYIKEGVYNKGISDGTCRNWYVKKTIGGCSIFPSKNKNWKVKQFSCHMCGAIWESEPYEC